MLGTKVNPANKHDSSTFQELYQEVVSRFGVAGDHKIRAIGLDAGYKTPAIAREIILSGITPLLPYTAPKGKRHHEDKASKIISKDFIYSKQHNWFVCPNKCLATPRGMSKETGYVVYRTSAKDCNQCPFRSQCLSKTAKTKTLNRHIWQKYLDEAELIRNTEYHQRYYALRKRTIERVFADAKEKHGLRYTRVKGKQKVQDETLLVYACMNLKKMAMWTATSLSDNTFYSSLFTHNIAKPISPSKKAVISSLIRYDDCLFIDSLRMGDHPFFMGIMGTDIAIFVFIFTNKQIRL